MVRRRNDSRCGSVLSRDRKHDEHGSGSEKADACNLDGDTASHRALLEGLSRRLRAYYWKKLASVGRRASEAEDLEAVLAIHIKRHTYDPTDPFTPWVHAIARHKLIDFLCRTRTPFAEVPLDKADEAMASDDRVSAESSYDIQRLLQRLPPGVKCSMEAVKLNGLSIAEAAARCGLSESGVKVNIHRGLKVLAALIARESRS